MLTLRDVHKSYGSTVAVDGLSLHIEAGEVFGLLGPNGAGKSTTIGMAVGLLRPDRGSVELAGLGSPTKASVRRHLGACPQQIALYEQFSGEENLLFLGKLHGLDRATRKRRAAELLERVGLTARARDRVSAYSGGMQRRLNIAAALVHDPQLVLLDEPTAGVDPHSRHALFELVRALKSEGRTVVYTTHYMEEAQRLCDRVGVIDQGRVLALGTVDELIAAHGGQSVVTVLRDGPGGGAEEGEPERIETDDPMREIARVAAEPGAREVRLERPDLEGVFLHLTGRSLRD
ncbi:MAG: ABC transporter ATP-binding protein [Phycisphaerales bacterium]|nr:MAG: ABC transporter ATP-binding protein [Phycisphaerales bacterium]